ncbi:hypothetical protein IAT38_007740 [Cryptococcus sp. DSM 104549]
MTPTVTTPALRKSRTSRHPPSRDSIPSLESMGIELHPDTSRYVYDSKLLADSLGGNGFSAIFSNPVVLTAAFSACMGGLLFGFDQGILAIVLTMPQFLSRFPAVDPGVARGAAFNKGIMTALLELGALLGALQSGFLADRFSRKRTIAMGSIWFVVGSIIQATAYSFGQLVVGRFIGGVGIGVLSSVAPMYISEIAPPNVRGAFLTLEGATIVFGIVSMFYITYGTRHFDGDLSFRFPFAFQMAPCLLLAIGLYHLPYSPRWLAQVGRDRSALSSLMRLRRLPSTDPRLQAEWITIRSEAVFNREVVVNAHPGLQGDDWESEVQLEVEGWKDMFKPGVLRRTMVGVMLMVFQQFVGVNALIYYSPSLFEQLGLAYESQLTLSGILNICQLLANLLAFCFLDRVGRRPPLLAGSAVMTLTHGCVALVMAKCGHDWKSYPVEAALGVGCILVFMFAFGLGWAVVPWSMPAEVHSSSRRAKGVAITTCVCWLGNFIIGLITPPMLEKLGYGTFVFFAVWSALSGVWTWFLCPETSGKTLEQMDEVFHTHTAHEEALAKAEIDAAVLGTTGPDRVVAGQGVYDDGALDGEEEEGEGDERQRLIRGKAGKTGDEQWVESV